jgi:hypothetical protein
MLVLCGLAAFLALALPVSAEMDGNVWMKQSEEFKRG